MHKGRVVFPSSPKRAESARRNWKHLKIVIEAGKWRTHSVLSFLRLWKASGWISLILLNLRSLKSNKRHHEFSMPPHKFKPKLISVGCIFALQQQSPEINCLSSCISANRASVVAPECRRAFSSCAEIIIVIWSLSLWCTHDTDVRMKLFDKLCEFCLSLWPGGLLDVCKLKGNYAERERAPRWLFVECSISRCLGWADIACWEIGQRRIWNFALYKSKEFLIAVEKPMHRICDTLLNFSP